jgi:Ca2+-binding RTX toxin-like protein
MANITLNRGLPGFSMTSSNVFDDVETLEILTRTSTRLSLDDDGDRVSFIGSGIGYQMSGGNIVGITGGTVTGISITNANGGVSYVSWTGLSVSAKNLFTYAVTDNWTALNALLFNTGDTFRLTDRADQVRGFGGNDTMYGFGGNDRLFGDAGNDKLYGGNGADRLDGGTGADTLVGGAGVDTLAGGAGADVFLFTHLGAANRDIISDFKAVDDALQFDDAAFTAFAYTGQLRAADFVQGTAAADRADRFIYQKSTGNLWYDADGSGAGAKVLVAELVDNTALTAADIFII